MRRLTLIRYGLGALVLAGTAGGLGVAGCGGDDSVAPGVDGGKDVMMPPPGDGGGMDQRSDSPVTADAGTHAKIILVHASADLGPVRVCFAIGKKADGSDKLVAPIAALPDVARGAQPFPGIYPGTGGPFPDLTDLSKTAITPYFVLADRITGDTADAGAAERKCDGLIGNDAGGLVAGTDYFEFPTIPAGTFVADKTFMIGLTGCRNITESPTSTTALCGADYVNATGNLALKSFSLDRTSPGTTALGASFANLSTSQFAATVNGVYPFIVNTDAADASTAIPISTTPAKFPELKPSGAGTPVPNVAANSRLRIAAIDPVDGGVGPTLGGSSLPIIQLLTIGSATVPPNYFKNGAAYTFVMVGDPTIQALQADGGFDGYGLHFLGFSNDPALN